MKTVKRIFAVAVAVLLIAMMIPTAFAAENNTVNWTCSKPGYTYTVYKVAGYNAETGEYPAEVASMQNTVNAAVTKAQMANLADTCATATGLTDTGKSFNTNSGSGSFTLDDGIYFIKMTGEAPNFKSIKPKMQSIVVFPNKNGTTEETINFTDKINEGEPTTSKYFLVDGNLTQDAQSAGTVDTIGGKDVKTITYVLEADIPGSATNKLTSYVITDRMDAGLKDVTASNIDSVVVKPASGESRTLTTSEWSFTTASSDINCTTALNGKKTEDNTFGIKLAASVLSDTTKTFYGEGNKVVVTFHTELNYDDVKDMIGQEIENHDDMIYGNTSGLNVVPGNEVVVKTYNVLAQKLDANTNQPVSGKKATFGLFEDEACKKLIKSADSDTTTGMVDFGVTLPAGTYYVKETKQPDGYNINTTVTEVKLGDKSGEVATTTVVIKDTPAKLPSTGGAGTLVFTIVGGSLVVLAAALFIIVMKKRSSAK